MIKDDFPIHPSVLRTSPLKRERVNCIGFYLPLLGEVPQAMGCMLQSKKHYPKVKI